MERKSAAYMAPIVYTLCTVLQFVTTEMSTL
jgi:hypothetical protein